MRLSILAVLVCLSGPAAAEGEITPADLKALREEPMLFTDGKGHYFAFPGKSDGKSYVPSYYGDKAVLYRTVNVRVGEDGAVDGLAGFRGLMWSFTLGPDAVVAACGSRKVSLEAVPRDLAKRIVRDATFKTPAKWNRMPLRLARDDAGVYYYVDAVVQLDRDQSDHRLFIGKRGAARRAKLKDIIIDSAGELYVTDRGTFKVNNPPEGSSAVEETWWIAKGASTRLTTVQPSANIALVYTALGAYDGEMLGYPCDMF